MKNKRRELHFRETSSRTSRAKKTRKKADNRELFLLCIYSIALFLFSEMLARRSYMDGFMFMVKNPLKSMVNILIIFLPLSISTIVKRKKFIYFIVSVISLLLAFTSGLLMDLRGMPLFPYDIKAFKEAIELIGVFLSRKEIILIVISLIVFLGLSILIFILEGRQRKRICKRNALISIIIAVSFSIILPQLSNLREFTPLAWNPGQSYKKLGFDYAFTRECISSHRTKPEDYSEEKMKDLRAYYDKKVREDKRIIYKGQKRPNVIVVQLEAFMDPTMLKGVKFNKDPMPNMRKLMNKYTGGLMEVPVTGGGTARTEYEVLSGSDFEFLNQGEIPYQTFLSENPSISLATNFKKDGYKAVAIHNFYKKFYNRDVGLENLGFDKFIPLDIMTNVEYTPEYWPKDNILTGYIADTLGESKAYRGHEEGKKEPKFIFTISTQGHSKYPKQLTKEEKEDFSIKVVGSKLSEVNKNQIEYYANQVKEMDDFVGDLVKLINRTKKPTVLAMYGDHLPGLNIITQNEAGVDKYQSLFVLVNNFGKKVGELPKKFESNDLGTYVEKLAGQPYGPINLVHAYSQNDKDYKKNLELVQYDILFGKKYFLKDNEMPKRTKMEVNSEKLKIKKVITKNGEFYLKGEGVNRNTAVYLDGKKVESDYYDDKTLKLYDTFYTGKKEIQLKILDNNGNVIQSSNKIEYKF